MYTQAESDSPNGHSKPNKMLNSFRPTLQPKKRRKKFAAYSPSNEFQAEAMKPNQFQLTKHSKPNIEVGHLDLFPHFRPKPVLHVEPMPKISMRQEVEMQETETIINFKNNLFCCSFSLIVSV